MNRSNRKLNSLEKTFYEMNKAQPFTVIICAHLKGELTFDILKRALDIMKNRHFYLSYSIQEKEDGLAWVFMENATIPIEIIEHATEEQWIEICNYEMNAVWDFKTASLAKVILLKKASGTDLIFKISHIIGDGISLFHFVRESLNVIDGLYKEMEITFPYKLTNIYPDEQYFPFYPKELNESIKSLTIPSNLPNYRIEERFTHILPYNLSENQSKTILSRCKEKGVTLNSLLAASLVININNHILNKVGSKDEYTIKSSSGLDLRPYYQVNVPREQLGCWAGFGVVYFESSEVKDIWDCAQLFQSRLREVIDEKRSFLYWKKSIENYSMKSSNSAHEKKGNIPYGILTNIGKLEIEEWYGQSDLKLERISFMTPMHRHWENDLGFGIGANSFNNCINLIFHYMSPARSQQEAKDFANQIIFSISNA